MKTHKLKILPEYFNKVVEGTKTFEVRLNDRDFKIGDCLVLKEWNNGEYTNREYNATVTYILDSKSGYVSKGYVIMAIKKYGEDN